MSKEQYIEAIYQLMNESDDMVMLEFIYILLKDSESDTIQEFA